MKHADHVARIEQVLRDARRPYVAVDDVKRAVFSPASRGNFDLLICMGSKATTRGPPPGRPRGRAAR